MLMNQLELNWIADFMFVKFQGLVALEDWFCE